jgi:tetratricopeptide (TPR) repeat protein
MKKAFLLVVILFVSVISTACINNLAVQELNTKAKSYLDKGDFNNAINRLEASIDLDNTIFETHYNLGIAYTQAEKYPQAVETFKNATKLKPDFADTYYSLAVAQENYAKGIIDGSIKDDKKVDSDDKVDDADNAEDSSDKKKVLTKEEKAQVAQLMNDSITSYTTYLEKGKEIQDKQEVEEKIEYLKTQLPKYSSEKQQ